MGRYHAYDENGALYPLHPNAVVKRVRKGKLLPPTADELSDKSKGDILSKGLAILQTMWFVAQCIARLIKNLPLAHLEVMTLAYTVMTVAMYIAWGDKPLSVNCAIRVPGVPVKEKPKRIRTSVSIMHYVFGTQDADVDIHKLQRVPTFWAGTSSGKNSAYADAVGLLVAMAFGAVHCIAWSYTFPSQVEVLLWRVSAVAIVAFPAGCFLAIPFIWNVQNWEESETGGILDHVRVSLTLLSVIYVFFSSLLYIAARMILLFLSFTALKGLPYAVFQAIQWIEFVPHL